jgi:hypothetical protein
VGALIQAQPALAWRKLARLPKFEIEIGRTSGLDSKSSIGGQHEVKS